jgi:hypothetical protein
MDEVVVQVTVQVDVDQDTDPVTQEQIREAAREGVLNALRLVEGGGFNHPLAHVAALGIVSVDLVPEHQP